VTVLVCIPYYRTPEYVERAVDSVLAQTYRDFVCVVIGDGDRSPERRHPKLVSYSYPRNRGAYFAQDVAIWASPHEWYAVVASDDWVDPDHLERLIEQNADLACGALWSHGESERFCGPGNAGHLNCRGKLTEKAYEVGIYRTERYREIGAHNPGERLGQDTLTLRVMRLVGPVGASMVPTYNRLFRPGSLCTDPLTGAKSKARRLMRQRNRRIIDHCARLGTAEAIRVYRESLIPPDLRDELAERSAELRAYLA
jgi:glycosyltransferase involved in cell wall biosynthesis